MEIQQLIDFGVNYLSDYFSYFISTIRSPSLMFPAIRESKQDLLVPKNDKSTNSKLNPKLIGFLIISIFLGSTINSVAPLRPKAPELLITTIVTLVIWFAYSLTIYGVFRIFSKKGYFWEIMSVSLQLLAVIYVVSNIVMFIWSVLAQFITLSFSNTSFPLTYPIITYSLMQYILMIIYLPIALKKVHDFGKIRRVVVSVLPPSIWTSFGILLLSSISITTPRIKPTPIHTSMWFMNSTVTPIAWITPTPLIPMFTPTIEVVRTQTPLPTPTIKIVDTQTPLSTPKP